MEWLKDWQTLVSALIALVAAIATIYFMHRQTRFDRDRHRDLVNRKMLAARARMPDALSELSSYIRDCCKHLIEGEPKPEPPVAAVSTLKDVIEFIDNHEATKTFELVSWYQVQRARLMADRKPKPVERDEQLYDAVLLQAFINRLYEYARNEEQSTVMRAPTRSEMIDSLKNAVSVMTYATNVGILDGVMETIQRRHP